MKTDIYWIRYLQNGQIGLMPRPRGGDWLLDEIENWRLAKLNTIVSLLESHEIRELDLNQEANLCQSAGIQFISFPIIDRGVPDSIPKTFFLVNKLTKMISNGFSIGIHCRAGIGRTGLLAACILFQLGVPKNEIFQRISQARGVSCPDTELQIKWFTQFTKY